jgi:hypothetical protein
MKTKALLLLITSTLITVFSSCEKDVATTLNNDPNTLLVCGTKDPLNNLKWLSDEMRLRNFSSEEAKMKLNGVVLFDYKGNQVIEVQCSVCSSTNIHQYYCDGTKLDFVSTDENVKRYNDYVLNRKEIKILYGTKIWK